MKGITPVIATILLLLITISMVGFAFVWFSGMLSNVATTSENATNQQMIQMNQKINIESAKSGNITVRNVGTYSITNTSLFVYKNGVYQANCTWKTLSVAPQATITVAAVCSCNAGDEIKVSAPGGYDVDSCIAS